MMQEAGLQVIEVNASTKCSGSNLTTVVGEEMHSSNLNKRSSAKQGAAVKAHRGQVRSFPVRICFSLQCATNCASLQTLNNES